MKYGVLRSCCLLLATAAWGTTVVKMDLPQLVGDADSIIHGRIEQVYAQWDDQMKLVFTFVDVRIYEPLKGERRQSVLLRQLGGKIGALNMSVAGMPHFNRGDEVILFLKGNAEGTYHTVGLNQGKYDVLGGFAVSKVSDVQLFDSKTGQFVGGPVVTREPLESFKAKIRGMLQ